MAQAAADFNTVLERSLATLPANERVLIPLYEAYRLSSKALLGVLNQPRTPDDAVRVLEDEMDRLNDLACAVAIKLSHLPSIDEYSRESYLETMVSHVFYSGGNAADALEAMVKAGALPTTKNKHAH